MKKSTKFLAFVLAAALSSSVAASGPTDIVAAAQAKNVATVKKLLKDGADVNAATGDGMTALHWAALNGDADAVKVLVAAGARLEALTRNAGGGNANLLALAVDAARAKATLGATKPVRP